MYYDHDSFQALAEPQKQPELILSPADVSKLQKSNLQGTQFANEEYREIAELLEKLAVLERRAETKIASVAA